MKKALLILADGFEEVEAIFPCDLLRRAGAQVDLACVSGPCAKGSHGIEIKGCISIEDAPGPYDLVIIPGGMPGASNIASSWPANKAIVEASAQGAIIASICASPAVVLGPLGLLDGHKATCYPGMGQAYPAFQFSSSRLVEDGKLITASGPGAAEEFGLALVKALFGESAAQKMRRDIQAR